MFMTAAFTGLRMGELLALRWHDVDFTGSVLRVRASYYNGQLDDPEVGQGEGGAARTGCSVSYGSSGRREDWVGDDDLVFVGATGDYLDGSALRRRYKAALAAAALRPLRFHDLRHTFGTRMIAKADIRRVQEWMGHADVHTTMRYLHYAPHQQDARLVAEAFAVDAGSAGGTSRDDFVGRVRTTSDNSGRLQGAGRGNRGPLRTTPTIQKKGPSEGDLDGERP